MGKRFIDISIPISGNTLVYQGDPPISIEHPKSISNGDLYNLSVLSFGSHSGTHMDAPKHFCDEGCAVDELDATYFVGRAKVFDMADRPVIDMAAVSPLPIESGDRILFKTANSHLMRQNRFSKTYVYIAPEAAQYLADKKIKTVGIDYLTVEQFGAVVPATHYAFLRAGIVILEGLDLTDAEEGVYELISLPVKITGGNGSPMRAMLVTDTN